MYGRPSRAEQAHAHAGTPFSRERPMDGYTESAKAKPRHAGRRDYVPAGDAKPVPTGRVVYDPEDGQLKKTNKRDGSSYQGYTGLVEAAQKKQAVAAAAAAAPEAAWLYVDASGTTQGQYPLASMKEWFAQGFLPLDTKVKTSTDADYFLMRQCPEIAGAKASPRTAEQWKVAGNAHMAAGKHTEATEAYGSALDTHPRDAVLRGALLSNRSGAYLLLDDADAAEADARQCLTARPDWAKAHWRLASALVAKKDLPAALEAADKAEKLDPLPAHTETKHAALELFKAETAAMAEVDVGDERAALLRRLRCADEDTDLRLRCKRVKEQEERDADAQVRGLDGTGEVWRKESASDYAARRERLSLLEKIDRAAAVGVDAVGGGNEEPMSEQEKAELVDEQLAHSQKHANIEMHRK